MLSLQLTAPAHTLLPSCPPSPSHTLTITLQPSHNPLLALEKVFPGKKAPPPPPPPARQSVRGSSGHVS